MSPQDKRVDPAAIEGDDVRIQSISQPPTSASRLLLITIRRPLSRVRIQPRLLLTLPPAEKDPLHELIQLNPQKEQGRLDKHNPPLPRDRRMSKHLVVDNGDINKREDSDEAGHNGPEEELVPPDVVHPLCEVLLGFGLHAEEAAAHVDHFPREEESEPGQTDKGGGARAEDRIALRDVVAVAAAGEVAVAEREHDQGEG